MANLQNSPETTSNMFNMPPQTEVWRDVKDFKGHFQISDLGNVRGVERTCITKNGSLRIVPAKLMILKKKKTGYIEVHLRLKPLNKYVTVHILVGDAFLPNPLNLAQINHINGDKTDNRLCNLERCSAAHNTQHAYRTGLAKGLKGEKNPANKHNECDIKEILQRFKNGEKPKELAKEYGIDCDYIYDILNGKTWKHLQ